MEKYKAEIMPTGEEIYSNDIRRIIESGWLNLCFSYKYGETIEIDFFRFNDVLKDWEYMGSGTNESGFCTIIGRFTRSFDNYLNDRPNIVRSRWLW